MFLTKLARRTYSEKCSLNISAVRLFRFMRQRYGTAGDWEKTQKGGVVKNAKSTPPRTHNVGYMQIVSTCDNSVV